jgi:hypothetical protein
MRFLIFTCLFLLVGCPKKESESQITHEREPIFIDIDDDELDDLPEAEDSEDSE